MVLNDRIDLVHVRLDENWCLNELKGISDT